MSTINTDAWGATPPEFIRVLDSLVRSEGSRAAAAKKIGVSRASVSTLLAGQYPSASTDRMEKRIMIHAVVACPLLGQLSAADCLANRQQSFSPTNPQRVALYRACRNCQHNPEAVNDA